MSTPNTASLGSCCVCGGKSSVRNIVMLDKQAPEPAHGYGWGCLVCGLPNDGAVAVVCDACLEAKKEPTLACVGFPAADRRMPIAELTVPHLHDLEKHAEYEARFAGLPGR